MALVIIVMVNSPGHLDANPLDMCDLPRCATVLGMAMLMLMLTKTITIVVFMVMNPWTNENLQMKGGVGFELRDIIGASLFVPTSGTTVIVGKEEKYSNNTATYVSPVERITWHLYNKTNKHCLIMESVENIAFWIL